MNKKNVYVFQINNDTNKNLLPIAAGLLVSYAKSIPFLNNNFNFSIKISREDPIDIVNTLIEPKVVAFSCYCWNINHSIAVAKLIKEKYPNCLIIFGGQTNNSASLIESYSFSDIFVHGEGEITFSEILSAIINNTDFKNIKGISFMRDSQINRTADQILIDNLDIIPSPFLEGIFDELLKEHRNEITGVLWETNRGCPYTCSYCSKGIYSTKIRAFSTNRLCKELEWINKNKFLYMYCTDSNFSILERDFQIAEIIAGFEYPKYLHLDWIKNISEKTLQIADILQKADKIFYITLSVQSFNPDTLKAVKRYNINLKQFNEMINLANKKGILLYTELIMALPNETLESFISNTKYLLLPNLNYHFIGYLCSIIPGSEMATPEYRQKYKIETVPCLRDEGRRKIFHRGCKEMQDIVISTFSLPFEDWKKLFLFQNMVMLLYNFRLVFFILNYLKYNYNLNTLDTFKFIIKEAIDSKEYNTLSNSVKIINSVQKSILETGSKTIKLDFIEDYCWEAYEAALLDIIVNKEKFYNEILSVIKKFLKKEKVNVAWELLLEVFAYQSAAIPDWKEKHEIKLHFNYNLPNYFKELCLNNNLIKITKENSFAQFGEKENSYNNPVDFANYHFKSGCRFIINKVDIVLNPKSAREFKNAIEHLNLK